MSDSPNPNAMARSFDDMILRQRKERKELLAQTQKMKHSIPKGNKKKKKDVTEEITQMLADQELIHSKEVEEFGPDKFSKPLEDTSIPASFKDENEKELLKIDPEENSLPECSSTGKKISKAQKRRIKKNLQEKERKQAIAEQELHNLSGMRFLELQKITQKLSERKLAVYEIPSDGNCLYKAIQHQLSILKPKEEHTVPLLRLSTSKQLMAHKDDYIPFLTDPKTGNTLSDEQYVEYCDDIINTSTWGGHVEIQALSCIYDIVIEVIQADGPSIIVGDESKNPKLIISFHRHAYGLGEHYNSTVATV